MTVTLDNGDFDPGETTYLIEKPLPKKTSTTTTGISTRLYYLKQAAPIFFAMVLSFLAGRNYPTSKAPLVGIANLDSLQSSSRKFPLFQDELQVAEQEQCNCTVEDCSNEETEEMEEKAIDGQLNHTRDDPGLALNISAYIVEVINRTGSLDMEMILNEVNNTFDLGIEEDFYELIDTAFLHSPDLMEDLSELIEDENHTNFFIQANKNPSILSEVKNFTVTREEMNQLECDLIDEAVTMGRGAQDDSVAGASVQASNLDVENGFSTVKSMSNMFLDLPVETSFEKNVGFAAAAEESQGDAVSMEDKFKDSPESLSNIKNAYKSLADARFSQIENFLEERTETIYDTDSPSSAPSSAPSSEISRESQRSLRYLTNTPANQKERLISSSELEKMNVRRPKKQFTVQPISNTRKLLNLANQHVSSGFSQRLRSLAENHNRTLLGQELCDDENDSLICQGANLLASARNLDDMFCELSTLLAPIDDTMNGLNETRTSIDTSASVSKVVLIALKIGTALPYGIGSILNGVHKGLKPVEANLIKKLDKAAETAYRKVVEPWDRTVGNVLDQIDDSILYFMTYASLIETIGGFLEDESSCLADILLAVLNKAAGDVSERVGEALENLIGILNDITNQITDALGTLLNTLRDEVWRRTNEILDGIVEAGKSLLAMFSPLEILVDIFNTEIKIPWFHLPYQKQFLGSAQCPSRNWDSDVFNKNCYKKCQSGFEDVPHLTAWKCRPKCSSMNSYAGVGGCWNTHYTRQTKWPRWGRCGSGWDRVLFRCGKKCRAGFTAPWMASYCYQTTCPANFSPRLGNRFCARNTRNKQRRPTSCDKFIDNVPADRTSYRDAFGQCRLQCRQGHVDMGLVGCFQPATLSISIQDVAEALENIINAITGLPIVSTIQNALNDIIGTLLTPIQAIVSKVIDVIGGFNLDFLNGFEWFNPLDVIQRFLPILPTPLFTPFWLNPPFDTLLEDLMNLMGTIPIPEFLQELIDCANQGVACFLQKFPLLENIDDIIKEAQNLSENVKKMLEVLQDCAYPDDNRDDAKSITAAISGLIDIPLQDDTCTLKLPLPECGHSKILLIQDYVSKISMNLSNLNLKSNSRGLVEATNIPRFDGMFKILSVDILSPNDQVFIKSGVHRLHVVPKTDNQSNKEVYDIFRYEKIPSTKLNVYMKQDLSLPVVEYESSIEWNIFTKKDTNARTLLNTVVASLNVFLWEEMYWDLEEWCFQWNTDEKKYEHLPDEESIPCTPIYAIETKLLGIGKNCRSEGCNVPLMEDLLVENSDLSKYWKDETNVDSAARCALSLNQLYNDAVDAKSAFVSENRLPDYLSNGLKKDKLKILSVPLSITNLNSTDQSFNGNDYYHLGFGNKATTEMSDISGGSRTRIKKGNFQTTMALDTKDWHSISVGDLVNSFQSRKRPIFKDNDMKIGFSGMTVTFSATKAMLNTDALNFELSPTKSPTSSPSNSPSESTLSPTKSPTSSPSNSPSESTPSPTRKLHTYDFPLVATTWFVHGLCAMGVSSFKATATDQNFKYEVGSDNLQDGVKVWSNREYVFGDIQGTNMCEGGIYLKSNLPEESPLNTAISVEFTSKDESDIIICAFVSTDSRNGNWNVLLPSQGFRASEPFKYTGRSPFSGNVVSGGMRSYCKTMKDDPTPSPKPDLCRKAGSSCGQAHAFGGSNHCESCCAGQRTETTGSGASTVLNFFCT